jgi:hypothetical protein
MLTLNKAIVLVFLLQSLHVKGQRSAMLWTVGCDGQPSDSERHWKSLASHIDACNGTFDTLSVFAYTINTNGSFGHDSPDWSPDCGQLAETYGFPALKRLGLAQFPLVHVAGSTGDGMLATLETMYPKAKEWIQAAVDKATQLGFSGYNLDFEINFANGTAVQREKMIQFMSQFEVQLRKSGMRLTSDIGSCPSGFNGAYRCDDYMASSVDAAYSMKTYWGDGGGGSTVKSFTDFKAVVLGAVKMLGGKYRVGLNLKTPGDILPEALVFITKQHIREVSIWKASDYTGGFPSADLAKTISIWKKAPEVRVLRNTHSDPDHGPLYTGQYIRSPGGKAHLVVTDDGELCVGTGDVGGQGKAVWCSPSAQGMGPHHAQMQTDGNLCVVASDGKVAWCAGSGGNDPGDFCAAVDDTCGLCVYSGTLPHKGAPLWCASRDSGICPVPARVV